jgi:ABC-type transport system involved in cytochrome c biogenesis permease subunit
MKKLIFLSAILFSMTSFSLETFFCSPELESLPILEGGRIKPLYVTAEESLKFLAGKQKTEGLTRTQMYCLLSLKDVLKKDDLGLKLKIEHVKIQEMLGLSNNDPVITYDKLHENSQEIRFAMVREKGETSLKKALEKLLNQLHLYDQITRGEHWVLPRKTDGKIEWIPMTSYFSEEDFKNSPSQAALFEKIKESFISVQGDKYLFELQFLKLNLPIWALLFTSLALISLVVFKNFNIVLGFTSLTFFTQMALMVCRIIISGRAPVTNMYETVMFSGFGSLLLGWLLGHFLKEKIYVYLGLAYNMCTLLMLNFASGLISASISPLVPVLRDNFWLSTHVTSVVLSYGGLALSWILANVVIIRKRFFSLSSAEETYYSKIIYNCIKFGATLLFFGIMLGGVWADYSWGRFWGWDPKETWSLIVFCIYMAILHGKYTTWLPTKHFIPAVAMAFLSVMMAWFGVNYILAAGLHSYGFSQGGALFLTTFFIIQILLVVGTRSFKLNK